MRLSNLASGFVCTLSLAAAGHAWAVPPAEAAKDVRVINTTAILVDVGTAPIPVDVGTAPIPVDVGGTLDVNVTSQDAPLEVTAPDPIRVIDGSLYAERVFWDDVGQNGSYARQYLVPPEKMLVIEQINVVMNTDAAPATASFSIQWSDGLNYGNAYVPLEKSGDKLFAIQPIHIVLQYGGIVNVFANTGADGDGQILYSLTGYMLPAP